MVDEISEQEQAMLLALAKQIGAHERFGPAVTSAVEGGRPLALNYHTHEAGGSYCVSVCAVQPPTVAFFGKPELEELAHVRGFGESAEQCISRHPALTRALKLRFESGPGWMTPALYLNGEPHGKASS